MSIRKYCISVDNRSPVSCLGCFCQSPVYQKFLVPITVGHLFRAFQLFWHLAQSNRILFLTDQKCSSTCAPFQIVERNFFLISRAFFNFFSIPHFFPFAFSHSRKFNDNHQNRHHLPNYQQTYIMCISIHWNKLNCKQQLDLIAAHNQTIKILVEIWAKHLKRNRKIIAYI